MLWVGQFNLVQGEAQEDGPWACIFPHQHKADIEASDLYLVIEAADGGSEDYFLQLRDIMGEMFQHSKLSITGGLLRAHQAANRQLRDWNRRSFSGQRLGAGASLLALKDSEAYLAQVGPSIVYRFSGGKLSRIEPDIPEAIPALGAGDDFWPSFRRLLLAEGDTVLLASSNLAGNSVDMGIAEALAGPPEECLPRLFREASHLQDCAALLLASRAPEKDDEA